jgi:hypothetical protein
VRDDSGTGTQIGIRKQSRLCVRCVAAENNMKECLKKKPAPMQHGEIREKEGWVAGFSLFLPSVFFF